MFRKSYGEVFAGDERWNGLQVPAGERFAWDEHSTYVRLPPYFQDMPAEPAAVAGHRRARACWRCWATASRPTTSPRPGRSSATARRHLPAGAGRRAEGLQLLRLAPRQPRGDDARDLRQHPPAQPARRPAPKAASPATWRTARRSRCRSTTRRCATSSEGVELVVLAGKEYGSGSSRDWAAKGTKLLGVRAVIAQSFERIHRSNLVGMGVLPLQFPDGESAQSLGLTGEEVFSIDGLAEAAAARRRRTAARGARERRARRRRAGAVRRARAHRHAARGGVLPPRRHPPVRPATLLAR